MKIIIIGAGFTGFQVAKRLVAEKHEVVLIDNNEEIVRHASNRLDCYVLQENGNNLETLESAGIAKADALIALTDSDEINMITCSLVDSIYPNIKKIARVRNYDYYANVSNKQSVSVQNRSMYGIDYMIHPDVEAAKSILSSFKHGAVADVVEFADSEYEMTDIEIEKDSKLDGTKILDIKTETSYNYLIPFVTRNEETFLAKGDTEIHAGDRISLLIQEEDLKEFFKLTGSNTEKIKKIALIGAGRIGTNIAEGILKTTNTDNFFSKDFFKKILKNHRKPKVELVIIDKDYNLAKEASARFPEATVYNGDITDESFIEGENLSNFDLVIAATRNHELNMITSAYFKTLGCPRTICLVTSSSFASIARNIGIDVAIPIKDTVVDSIMSHLRGNGVTSVHTLSEGGFEIVEYEIPKGSKIAGKMLKNLKLDIMFLILLVKKQEKYTIAKGDTLLEEGDKIVFAVDSKENQKILEKFGG